MYGRPPYHKPGLWERGPTFKTTAIQRVVRKPPRCPEGEVQFEVRSGDVETKFRQIDIHGAR
jgi:hypothetical protein